MLKNISPLLTPELVYELYRMGHGEEIVFADSHFCPNLLGPKVLRCDGTDTVKILDGVLPLIDLDSFISDPIVMMEPVAGDSVDDSVEAEYLTIIKKHHPDHPPIAYLERLAFYERAKKALCIVITHNTRKYANIILTKGVLKNTV